MLARARSRFALLLTLIAVALTQVDLRAQSYTIAPSPFLTAFDNAGKIINNACIWTYAAGTSTPATTYSDTVATPNANPIRTDSAGRFTAYLVAGSSYKFVYESACTPPSHGTTLRTADNIAATPASSANVDLANETAGEAISAGQAVYLSDGSGGKIAGQWYKADSANAYSSTTNWAGIAPSAIASGATGTIRLGGTVTGLSSLSVGSLYYVSTSGAITTTAPANKRLLGQADSATSLVLTSDPPIVVPLVDPSITDGRCTLTSATPVTSADVTAATTFYYTPFHGSRIALYDGSTFWNLRTFIEIATTVPNTTNTNYDVFLYDNAGTVTLETLAWTNDTTRATALALQDGVWVKSGATTRKFVCSIRTTAAAGQTEDSAVNRFVYNYYNRVPRSLIFKSSTSSWTYATAAWRQANAGTGSPQVNFLLGQNEAPVTARLLATAKNPTVSINGAAVALGLDSTTTPSGVYAWNVLIDNAGTISPGPLVATYDEIPAVGKHTLYWLEAIGTANSVTFYGNGTPDSSLATQSGISGWTIQ